MSFFGNGSKVKDVVRSLVSILVVILLYSPFEIGNRYPLLDLVLFEIGFRLIGLAIIVGAITWAVRNGRGAELTAGLGGGICVFGTYSGILFLLAWLDPLSAQGGANGAKIYGVELDAWPAVALLAVFHIILIVGGLLLWFRAKRIIDKRGQNGLDHRKG